METHQIMHWFPCVIVVNILCTVIGIQNCYMLSDIKCDILCYNGFYLPINFEGEFMKVVTKENLGSGCTDELKIKK